MKRFIAFLVKSKFLSFATFGLTYLIRWLVKTKRIKGQYHFDIDKDGEVDASITFHGNTKDDKNSTKEVE